jgi:hypothetical protein
MSLVCRRWVGTSAERHHPRTSLVISQQCVAQIRQVFPKAHLFGCSTGGERR